MILHYLTLLLMSSFIDHVTSFYVQLYENKNHGGYTGGVNVNGCENLNDVTLYGSAMPWVPQSHLVYAADKVSSINTNGHCVIVYRQYDCQKAASIIKPGTGCHSNWDDCGFNDDIRSISTCDYMQIRELESKFYEGASEDVSGVLSCDCNTRLCSDAIMVSVTKSSSYSASADASVEVPVIKVKLSSSFGYTWGTTLTYSQTHTCGGNPGYRSWLVASPMWKETRYEITTDNGVSEEITTHTPVANSNGDLKLRNIKCVTEWYKSCSGGGGGSGGSGGSGGGCRGTGTYAGTHDGWCRDNCALNYCPSNICTC